MISILGCGWYGLALGRALVQDGQEVNGSTTSDARFDEIKTAGIKPYIVRLSAQGIVADADFFACDVLVISIPPRVRSGETDYVAKMQQLAAAITKYKIKQVIYISSTGVYPDENTDFNELDIPQPQSQSGKTLFESEEVYRKHTAFKTAIVRFGGLIGPGRHPGRFFAGKSNIPNGQAPVNLIHKQDCVQLTKTLIDKKAFGYTFNACAPHHPQKSEFYTQAALQAGLEKPYFVNELADWKTISSVNIPAILQYEFKISNWDDALPTSAFN